MNVQAKFAVFATALALAFGGAFGLGALNDAEETAEQPSAIAPVTAPVADAVSASSVLLPGLASADRGYALRLADTTPGTGDSVEVSFNVVGPDGVVVREYVATHEKEMHLILVRRDFEGFQHLHPERSADGTWTVPANFGAAGTYRAFADFAPAALGGQVLTLGADLFVPGDFQPTDLPAPSSTWTSDGYEVALGGTPQAGSEADLTFTVRRDGAPVVDLEPYLAAFGHLVALRSGDLAYLHTHPAQEAAASQSGGPDVSFATTFPTAGRYRLYLNFAHAGVVRTAEFTVDVPAGPATAAPTPAQPAPPAAPAGGHGGH
ncbi:MAG: hypothetical protein ACT4QF_01725 [Sporichthyaceae bacterium]